MLTPETVLGNVTLAEARAIQHRLRQMIVERHLVVEPGLVAGVDISGVRGDEPAIGAAILVSLPSLEVVETAVAEGRLEFPYVPGFLSFREAPLMLEALRRLKAEPDVVIVEGHGRAHPRGLGIASHIGIVIGKPTIGFAKSRLVGHYEEPRTEAGSSVPLEHKGEVVGRVLRTKTNVKPVFVSVGNLITLPEAVETIIRCTARGRRLPEPIRIAHNTAGAARKALKS